MDELGTVTRGRDGPRCLKSLSGASKMRDPESAASTSEVTAVPSFPPTLGKAVQRRFACPRVVPRRTNRHAGWTRGGKP